MHKRGRQREAGKGLHRRREASAANSGPTTETSKGIRACAMVGVEQVRARERKCAVLELEFYRGEKGAEGLRRRDWPSMAMRHTVA
jgi:hypothetical protein